MVSGPPPAGPAASPKQRAPAILRRSSRILVALIAACTAAGYAGNLHAYLDLLSAFQLQYLCTLLALAVLLAALRSWRWAALAGVGAFAAAVQVVPWYVAGPNVRCDSQPNLRLVFANVCQDNPHRDEIRRTVEALDPDLAVLQEINEAWRAGLQPLIARYPHSQYVPGTDLRGLLVLSRFPLLNSHTENFGNSLAPSLIATVDINNTHVLLVVTHPWPALDAYGFHSRNEQLNHVGAFLISAPHPCILVGDLNATMWSDAYKRLVRQSGLLNTRAGFGILPSFPMDKLPLLRFPIDHCLISPDLTIVNCRLAAPAGSDHAPLVVDLQVPSAN
jgi:endonuclease/exonuclease/phosphatase (EEP) superfamily protein YafD